MGKSTRLQLRKNELLAAAKHALRYSIALIFIGALAEATNEIVLTIFGIRIAEPLLFVKVFAFMSIIYFCIAMFHKQYRL